MNLMRFLFPFLFLLLSFAFNIDTVASPPTTYLNGGYSTISGVAFQGEPEKSYGWPVKVVSFDDALQKALEWNLNAFHVYLANDQSAGDMYPLKNVTGLERREAPRQSIGVILERTSVHD